MTRGGQRRLCLLTGGFPTPDNPARAVFNLRAAAALAEHMDVTVVFLRMWRPGRPRVRNSRQVFGRLLEVAVPAIPARRQGSLHRLATLANLYSYRGLGLRWLAPHLGRPDVIHSVGLSLPGIVGGYWARRLGAVHVIQVVGSDVNSEMPEIEGKRPVTGWRSRVDALACNSRKLVKLLRSRYSDLGTVRVVYRGVDLGRFTPDGSFWGPLAEKPPVRFLFLGGLPTYRDLPHGTNTKGGQTLMAAWSAAEEQLAKAGATMLFAGPGALSEVTNRWKQSLQHPERVFVEDAFPPIRIPELLRAAEVVVVPSREEGLPNVAVEAASSGCALLGSDVGGIGEVVEDGVTGKLVPAGDVIVLSESLAGLAASRKVVQAMGMAARRRMERFFDSRQYAPQMVSLYGEAAASQRALGR